MKCNNTEIDNVYYFYRDILELDVCNEWDTGIMIDTGSGIIEIFHNGEVSAKGTIRHFALSVTDTISLTERVRNAGYDVITKPKGICSSHLNAIISFVKGLIGEEIEFFQEINS
jgi:glyoxylase I family protein